MPKHRRSPELLALAATFGAAVGLAVFASPRSGRGQELAHRIYTPLLLQGHYQFPLVIPTAAPTATPEATPTSPPPITPTSTDVPPSATPTPTDAFTATPTATATSSPSPTRGTVPPTGSPTPTATTAPPTATPTRTATATLLPPLPSIFGVQASVPLYDHNAFSARINLEAVLRRVKRYDGHWVRVPVFWWGIEGQDTTPRTRTWEYTDETLGVAASLELEAIGIVYSHPPWAASRTCGMPDRVPLTRYGEFMRDLAERYDGDGVDDAVGSPAVKFWEIGNEPDFSPRHANGESDYGSCFGDDGGPEQYGAYLREAYKAIKLANPAAQVIFGAVAYERFYENPHYRPEHRGPFRLDFVREVLSSTRTTYGNDPAWPFFDVMAVHNYNDFRDNWDGTAGEDQELLGKIKNFRENQLQVAGQFDVTDKPLISSEVSLSSGPSNQWIQRSEEYQAAYVGQVYARAIAAGLAAAIWFIDEDFLVGNCNQPDSWQLFGLMRSLRVSQQAANCPSNPLTDYAPSGAHEAKPALDAFATAARILAGARFARQLTALETGGHREIQAYGFMLANGRAAYVAFTEHGAPLGRIVGGVPVEDVERDFTVNASYLPGWTGRVRVTDHLGNERVESGAAVTVGLTFRPAYIVVEP